MKKLNCIMLIDDNPDDNFYHERVVRKSNAAEHVISKETGADAIAYLKGKNNMDYIYPDLIFLDINMPGMNGWEFLEEYNQLDKELQGGALVVMLTTSENPDDKMKAMERNIIAEFKTKPLTKEMLVEIIDKYFN